MEPSPPPRPWPPPSPPAAPAPSPAPVPSCYRHPDRPTRLACSSCGRPICVDCVHPAAVGQKCPECAAPQGRSTVVTARQISPSAGAPVAIGLLAVNVAIAAVGIVAPDAWLDLLQRFAYATPLVEQGEWWRVLTAAFLHSPVTTSPWHLLFNMWALYVFGPQLERQVGSVPFALLYLGSAAGGSALMLLLGSQGIAVGASGAIFGLFGAWVAASLRARHTLAGRANLNNLLLLLAINLALPLFIPRVAWEAHVGGLVVGFAVASVWLLLGGRGFDTRGGVLARAAVAGVVLAASLAVAILA